MELSKGGASPPQFDSPETEQVQKTGGHGFEGENGEQGLCFSDASFRSPETEQASRGFRSGAEKSVREFGG